MHISLTYKQPSNSKQAFWILSIMIISFCLMPKPTFAKTNVDSLRKIIVQQKVDSNTLNAYQAITQHYFSAPNDSLAYFATQGYELFRKKGFEYGKYRMQLILSNVYSKKGELDTAKSIAEVCLKYFEKINYSKGIIHAKNSIGTIEGRKGNFSVALPYFLFSKKLAEQLKDSDEIANTCIKLGTVNSAMNNFEKAYEYYTEGIKIAESNHNIANLTYLHNNLAILYMNTGDTVSGVTHLLKSLEYAKGDEFSQIKITTLNNLGVYYKLKHNSKKALACFEEALAILEKASLYDEAVRVKLNIATVIGQKDSKKALEMLLSILPKAETFGINPLRLEVIKATAIAYEETGDFKNAYKLLDRSYSLNDSILHLQQAKDIAELQSQNDLELSNQKIKHLQQLQKKTRFEKIIFFCSTAILIAMFVVLLYYFQQNKKIYKKLQRREGQLDRLNKDKDKLFSIIGHDLRGPIGNIPVMIDLMMDSNSSLADKEFMVKSMKESAEVSIDILDKLLNWGKAQIKGQSINQQYFLVYNNIETNIKLLNSAAKKKDITIYNNVHHGTRVFADQDHFNFIIRNLLANAIKFTSNHGVIEIGTEISQNPEFEVFSVKDNGVGMEESKISEVFELYNVSRGGTANETGNSIGLVLCKDFVQQNGGEIWVESKPGVGSTFFFSVKLGSGFQSKS